MKNFTWKRGITLVASAAILGFFASQIALGIGSLQLSRNSGHERFSYDNFNPRFHVVSQIAATAEDVSIYCPGIKLNDRIFLGLEVDSIASALGTTLLVNCTDSLYIWANDTIRCSYALTVYSDLLIGWNKTTD